MVASIYSSACFVALTGFAAARPQISLPPLIPTIPGVTEPLSDNAPPLPILQLPTPALPSPAHAVNNTLKPKKFAHFWTGAGDNKHSDFLATYSLDEDTFGTLVNLVDINSSGNSPHHSGLSHDGKTLWGGGLLSLLKTQDTGYWFDTTDPYHPRFAKSDRAILGSIADEVRAKPDGGFFITYMGSAVGTSPGRLIETDAHYNIIHEWPEDVDGTLNILNEQFSPHGLAVDFERDVMVSTDFVVPLSILKPTTGIQHGNTVRLWRISDRKILSTLTIPDGQGIQDAKLIPNHPEGAFIATAVKNAQAWIIYPHRKGPNGKQGTLELLYQFPNDLKDSVAILVEPTKDGKFTYFTFTTKNRIVALDTSDWSNPKEIQQVHDIVGPHYVKVLPDQKHLLSTGYFVQAGQISVLNTPGDFKAHYYNINDDGSLTPAHTIDFESEWGDRGGARPHSFTIFDYSDPKKPVWY